jgi:hypothetical protein
MLFSALNHIALLVKTAAADSKLALKATGGCGQSFDDFA